eukprot:TRINITY_DN19505_c0_g1_i1.p1 TRINITY_DN19505_c0_g1~~TRINITY_DN19505_c0_g1_i1.p1  ORF type:complete len:500 (+),score=31.29 TRINITY_DN19505_c0_g1_i1:129-1628(+)
MARYHKQCWALLVAVTFLESDTTRMQLEQTTDTSTLRTESDLGDLEELDKREDNMTSTENHSQRNSTDDAKHKEEVMRKFTPWILGLITFYFLSLATLLCWPTSLEHASSIQPLPQSLQAFQDSALPVMPSRDDTEDTMSKAIHFPLHSIERLANQAFATPRTFFLLALPFASWEIVETIFLSLHVLEIRKYRPQIKQSHSLWLLDQSCDLFSRIGIIVGFIHIGRHMKFFLKGRCRLRFWTATVLIAWYAFYGLYLTYWFFHDVEAMSVGVTARIFPSFVPPALMSAIRVLGNLLNTVVQIIWATASASCYASILDGLLDIKESLDHEVPLSDKWESTFLKPLMGEEHRLRYISSHVNLIWLAQGLQPLSHLVRSMRRLPDADHASIRRRLIKSMNSTGMSFVPLLVACFLLEFVYSQINSKVNQIRMQHSTNHHLSEHQRQSVSLKMYNFFDYYRHVNHGHGPGMLCCGVVLTSSRIIALAIFVYLDLTKIYMAIFT